ncbi:MAG: class I SAM-dependent methyltransferase [Alphaproteobacteria bacterium]|nr:class I SAM-dependent methyltransferase [Alphaproteobacteria bacterium]
MPLRFLLKPVIRVGALRVIGATGKVQEFRGTAGPEVTIRLHDRLTPFKIFLNPGLHTGEAYMSGALTVEQGTVRDLIDLYTRNLESVPPRFLDRLYRSLRLASRAFQQYNPVPLARQHAAHHYDLSGALYDLFLDEDRQYSCAYFLNEDENLDQAQTNKKHHLAAKLRIKPGMKVLDIGSGWGGLGLYLAETCGADVTGITLSKEQHRVSNERAKQAGLADRVRFHLRDYREEEGSYDRIVSVGMFEHVGTHYYRSFFEKVNGLLTEDGLALLHSIGRKGPPSATNPWIRKYIFPGGYSPALSEVFSEVEKTGLWVTDLEILRLHYAETLKRWYGRFQANRERAAAIYDERFCRMWEFYLAGSEAAFRHQGHMVFQMQLTRRQEAVPLTRDYMTDWEHAQRGFRKTAA